MLNKYKINSLKSKKLVLIGCKHLNELEYYEHRKRKSQTEIHLKQCILNYFERIPQLLVQFYMFEFGKNSFEISMLSFRLVYTSCFLASFANHLFKIDNTEIYKKWTFILVRSFSNFLFLSSRLLSITAVGLACSYSLLIYLVFTLTVHFIVLFNFHFINYYSFKSNGNLGRQLLDCFILSLWRMNSFLEEMDLSSSYFLINFQAITLENTSVLFLFYLISDNVYFNYRIFLLTYVNMAFLLACLIELIVINLFIEFKCSKTSSFREKSLKNELFFF